VTYTVTIGCFGFKAAPGTMYTMEYIHSRPKSTWSEGKGCAKTSPKDTPACPCWSRKTTTEADPEGCSHRLSTTIEGPNTPQRRGTNEV
jgi:hypothetical protein